MIFRKKNNLFSIVRFRPKILLIGAGGHAKSCIDVIEQNGEYTIAGLVGTSREVGLDVLGYPVLGTDEDLPKLLEKYKNALITIGHIKTPEPRVHLFNILKKHCCITPTIISPLAYISSSALIGAGTIVMHGAIVNTGAVIGDNCIINSQSLVEHDVLINDHCHISTSSVVNGGVRIGERTFIGSSSSIKESINIGQGCLIGMGQRVLKSCDNNTRIPSLKVVK